MKQLRTWMGLSPSSVSTSCFPVHSLPVTLFGSSVQPGCSKLDVSSILFPLVSGELNRVSGDERLQDFVLALQNVIISSSTTDLPQDFLQVLVAPQVIKG